MTEHQYYNALASSLESNYGALHKAREQWVDWQNAWKHHAKDSVIQVETAWENLSRNAISLMLDSDLEFPAPLKEISHTPFGLYVRGNKDTLTKPAIAIIGTRKASKAGMELARTFARSLAEHGITIVSGLAFGVDSAAHRGALDADGSTIAVLGNGLDTVYPKSNLHLAEEIIDRSGAIVSEYPPETPSLPHRFLERNRIVSGLSLGILVIEAPTRSGSLATARFALDQNRDIFVIPGPVTNPNYAGSHALIQAGAALVTSPEDILKLLPEAVVGTRTQNTLFAQKLDETQKNILNVIQTHTGIDANGVAEAARVPIRETNQALTELLIIGVLKEAHGKYFAV
ncbi:MAG: DNA-processing protein DprA [Patescibacteria group bacterium]